MEKVFHYFPGLSSLQRERFINLPPLFREWNGHINLISRPDIGQLEERHILHSLAIAHFMPLRPGSRIADIGTGGGFPGIPLAIFFPETEFLLVDSIGKKVKAVQAMADALELKNIRTLISRAEEMKGKFDFVTGRAVTTLKDFTAATHHLLKKQTGGDMYTGILYLKGGDLSEEIKKLGSWHRVFEISQVFREEFFQTKKLVHIRPG